MSISSLALFRFRLRGFKAHPWRAFDLTKLDELSRRASRQCKNCASGTGGKQGDLQHHHQGSELGEIARTPTGAVYFVLVKTLVCPHCHTQVPENASVCTGCGAEVVRGLTRRQRSFVGLVFVAIAILIFGVFLRGYEVANGHPFLRSPKAEDGLLVIVGFVVVPYLVGINAARLLWRSRVRFFRSFQHQ